jgi:hypothetical protein
MKFIFYSLGLGFLSGAALAADLTLTDGRVLKDAVIRSQTPLTVIVKYSAGLASVAKQLLPPELSAQYPADEAAARELALKAERARAQAREIELAEIDRLTRARLLRQKATELETSQPAVKGGASEDPRKDVQKRAENYFKTEYDPVARAKNVSNVTVTFAEFGLINGWDKRWSMRGKCDVQSGELVKVYPFYSKAEIEESQTTGLPLDYTAQETVHYTLKTFEFEATYSTEGSSPALDVTVH